MEPLGAILMALSAGAPALQPIADQALKDAYAGLKGLLIRKYGPSNPKLESTLVEYAEDPETYGEPAARMLAEVGADRDQAVVDVAIQLLTQAEAARPGVTGGLVDQINAQGGKVTVVGHDVGTINM